MRRFVVVGHRAITSSQFNLNDLSGSTGRLDILLRCVNSAFFLSHDLRRDVELYLVLLGEPDPPKTIRLVGGELKYLNPDERSTGALIRNALIKGLKNETKEEINSSPGIYISNSSFEEVLKRLLKGTTLVYLKEEGGPFSSIEEKGNTTFILSDERNLSEKEEESLLNLSPRLISLGSRSYHSDHCITLVNWILDGAGKTMPD